MGVMRLLCLTCRQCTVGTINSHGICLLRSRPVSFGGVESDGGRGCPGNGGVRCSIFSSKRSLQVFGEFAQMKRIVVYRLGSLGDTLVVLPAFHLVRRAYPDSEITLLTNF